MNLIPLIVSGVTRLVNAFAIETVRAIHAGAGKFLWDVVLDSGKRILVDHEDLPAFLENEGVKLVPAKVDGDDCHIAALGVESILPQVTAPGAVQRCLVHTGSGAVLNVTHDDFAAAVAAAVAEADA